jgi:hypothetical protein
VLKLVHQSKISPSLSLAASDPAVSFETMMIDALEKRLIEALKTVDAHGALRPRMSTIQ